MADPVDSDGLLNVTIKRKSKKKSGFEVEKREDGYYYIKQIPKNCTKIAVGDRVLEINGTNHEDFKNQTNANNLVDSFRLEVIPIDDEEDGDDSEEEYEALDRSRSETGNITRSAQVVSSRIDDSSSRNVESHNEVNQDDSGYGENDNPNMDEYSHNHDGGNDDGFFVSNNKNTSMAQVASKQNETNDEKVEEEKKSWDRPYVSRYNPNDRFMISVTKGEDQPECTLGIDLVEFEESEIYVSQVDQGPFYETALNRGDRIISINGQKVPDQIDSVEEAMEIIRSRSKLTLFVIRPPKMDEGYKWVLENY